MPLTVVSRDKTRPARFDEHLGHAILVAECRVEEFLMTLSVILQAGDSSRTLSPFLQLFQFVEFGQKSSNPRT
jgi:hypothetical protein